MTPSTAAHSAPENAGDAAVSVTYGAVGATRAADLLRFPPAGYRPIERRARIGHGVERWEFACGQAMSWGIQRRVGFGVLPVASAAGPRTESVFSPDGHEFLQPGDTVVLRIWGMRAPARVVYTVDEENRRGFAYGTLPGHPEDGEEAFIVERRDDGSVWIVIRAFSRPSSRRWRAVYPALRVVQWYFTRRYLVALAGPID